MKFDVEADASGFTTAMNKVQESVMTTYERIEKQNKELDEALANGQKDIKDAIERTSKEFDALEESVSKQRENIKNLREELKKYGEGTDEYNSIVDKIYEENKELKTKQAELDRVNAKLEEYRDKEKQISQTIDKVAEARKRDKDTLVELLGGQEKYNTIISALPPALQSSQGGIMNMVKAAKAFIATPLGAVIAAIAAALKAVMAYFTGTVEGEQKFAEITGYVSGVMGKLNDILIFVGKQLVRMFTEPKALMKDFKDALVENVTNRITAMGKAISIAGDLFKDLFSGDWDKLKNDAAQFGEQMLTIGTGIEDVTGKLGAYASELNEVGKASGDLAKREKQLELERSEWAIKKAQLEAKRNQIMEKMNEGTLQEQLEASKAAIDINNQIAAQDKKLAREAYNIIKTKNSLSSSNTADVAAENQAAAEMARVDAEAAAANRRLVARAETARKGIEAANLALTEQQQEALKQITRQQQDNENAAAQVAIDAMNEGAMKQLKQRELNHKMQKEAIERNLEDEIKAARDAAKNAWKADTEHSNQSFDDGLLSMDVDGLSEKDRKVVENYMAAVKEAQQKAATAMQSEDIKYFNAGELIKQYQDFDQKRRSIEEKYAADRQQLQESLAHAQAEGNTQMVEDIRASLRQLDMSEAKDKMQNALDKLKADPAFIDAFQDLKKVSTDTLQSLYDQLQLNKDALTSLDPEQLKVITDLMNNMEDEMLNRSTSFEAYKVAIEGLKTAEENKAAADEKVRKAQLAYDTAVKLTGKDSVVARNQYAVLTHAIQEQKVAANDVVNAKDKERKAMSKVLEESDKLVESLNAVGDAIGGEAGQVIGLIKDIYDFTTQTMESVRKMTDTTVKAMSAMEKASVILMIISAAIKVFQKLHEITNKFSDSAAYDKAVEKQKAVNALADAVNNYTLEMIKAENEEKSWFGDDALGKLKRGSQEAAQVYQNYYDKLYQQQVEYRNKSKNDDNWTTTLRDFIDPTIGTVNGVKLATGSNDYQAKMTRAIDNLRIETRARKKSFMGIGGHDQETDDLRDWAKKKFKADLFDADGWINGKLAQQIIDSYGDKLQGETEDTLKQLVELKEQYDEYMSQLKDYVGQLYEPLVENFTDSIMDWLDTGKDALNSFKDYASDVFRSIVQDMLKTIVLDKVVGTFQDDIVKMYDDYSKGHVSEEDLMKQVANRTQDMVQTYEQQIPVLQAIAGNMNEILQQTTGIDITKSSSATATAGVASSFSQDSIDEANGRIAALQMGQQAQIEACVSVAALMPSLVSICGDSNTFLSDLRDLAGVRNSMLTDMYDRMGEIYKTLGGRLGEIANNTNEL